ncbi:MAG TPA: hypothetical protein VFD92_20900 [Candidatus Binatia bacterium]|nr:hypothetical protein [Candidatus Binatia bacterium]
MPLFLDEIWLNASSREDAARAYTAFRAMAESGSFPPGVTLKAGPWFSNEEPKVILILDIQDHTKTFTAFSLGVAGGLIRRRRLEPIVEASAVDELVAALR